MNNTVTKKTNFQTDYELERKFERLTKAILGNFFFGKNIEKDIHEAQDFAIYRIPPNTGIAVRWRREWAQRNDNQFNQLEKYGNEFTLRWLRPSGIITEIDKINQGFVDYILYGFVNEKKIKILQYFIGDLSIFRQINPEPIAIIPNNPHDSDMAVFNINQFPKQFILKWWQPKCCPTQPKTSEKWIKSYRKR